MNRKKFRAALAMLLCIVMTLTLTACKSSANTTQKAKDGDYSKKLKISFATVQVQDGVDYNTGDEFTKEWCKKYNIEWDIIPMTWDNWAEKMRVWINSGDMPDMATWNYVNGEAANYVDQGLIKKLPGNWKTQYPDLAKAYTDSVIGPQLDKKFDGTYYLTKPVFSQNKPIDTLVSHMCVYMRKDWAEAVGFPIKDYYTATELMQFARLVKEKDPGHVGSKLTGIDVRTGNMSLIFTNSNSTHSTLDADYYKDSSGKYVWGPANQDTLTGLKLYQQAYRQGLLNPEFYTLKENQDMEDFYVAGTAAMTVEGGLAYYYNLFAMQMKKNLNLDPDKALHRAFVVGEDGKYHSPETINFWTASIFSPSISSEKLSRILDMFNYSCTKEGQYSIRLGIKDTDWTESSDGTLKSLLPAGTAAPDKYKSFLPVYTNMYVLSDDFGLIDPSYPKAYRDNAKKLYQEKESLGDSATIAKTDWNAYFYTSQARQKVAFDYPTEYAQLILKSGDIETNWKSWVKDKMQLVQPVLDELNAKK